MPYVGSNPTPFFLFYLYMQHHCLLHSGKYYMGDFNGQILPATDEKIRMVLGEAALNEARRHPEQVVIVRISRIKFDVSSIINGLR